MSDSGVLYVGSRRQGDVYAVVDEDGDGFAETKHVLATERGMPNGIAWKDGSLFVAELTQVVRYDDIDSRLANPPAPKVIVDGLPDKRHHGWKYLEFGPDGRLYTNVGGPCNVCDDGDPFATILSFEADGSDQQVYARGVRQSVGFAFRPGTSELWFTDNGRDMLGDDMPPDELNRAHACGLALWFSVLPRW